MDPLNIGAAILFGLMIFGWLFQPARQQQGIAIRDSSHASVRSGGCGSLLVTGFLALLLLMVLFGQH